MPRELAKRLHTTVAVPAAVPTLPAGIGDVDEKASQSFIEYLTPTNSNRNTNPAPLFLLMTRCCD